MLAQRLLRGACGCRRIDQPVLARSPIPESELADGHTHQPQCPESYGGGHAADLSVAALADRDPDPGSEDCLAHVDGRVPRSEVRGWQGPRSGSARGPLSPAPNRSSAACGPNGAERGRRWPATGVPRSPRPAGRWGIRRESGCNPRGGADRVRRETGSARRRAC